MNFEQVFTYAWHDEPRGGTSVISVAYEVVDKLQERRWLLLAGLPGYSELLPFPGAADAAAFARAVLELPAAAGAYEREFLVGRTETRAMAWGIAEQWHHATLWVGRDPADGLRPYLAYQSWVTFPGPPRMFGQGIDVCCDDIDLDVACAEARALLAELGRVS
ncbi:hypothetical protein GCM10027168_00340 [Streptomyces capparidis]